MQRRAMRVIGATTHQVFAHVEGDAALVAEPVDHLAHLGHHFGADAVTGQDKKRRGWSWRLSFAVRGTDTLVIVPGNVYVFGPGTPAPWSSSSPHAAQNPLGRLRVEMEAAYRDDDVGTLILRAGDFIDTRASGNWFDRIMIAKLDKGRFVYPGNPDIDHAWAFLPDLTAAAVALADKRETLDRFTEICFPGYTASGRALCEALNRATGRPVTLAPFAWHWLALAAPLSPMMRCLREMRYLWDTPHSLDGAAFEALLHDFTATPMDQALARAVGKGI
jgi:nucleoside-diphosphate-sugar epimerase